ncbi:hypothetical protein GPALN_005353 [Globodera pallida]|nr:hypothetical protein GPALN_005353 [Globodera pallida]
MKPQSSPPINRELHLRSKQIAERLSESVHILDHDPSMALYRLQEHANKMVPRLVMRRHQMGQQNGNIQGACFDLDNAIQTLDQMKRAQPTFERIQSALRNSVYFKQQIEHEMVRKRSVVSDNANANEKL